VPAAAGLMRVDLSLMGERDRVRVKNEFVHAPVSVDVVREVATRAKMSRSLSSATRLPRTSSRDFESPYYFVLWYGKGFRAVRPGCDRPGPSSFLEHYSRLCGGFRRVLFHVYRSRTVVLLKLPKHPKQPFAFLPLILQAVLREILLPTV
jgi:hypothetical protein